MYVCTYCLIILFIVLVLLSFCLHWICLVNFGLPVRVYPCIYMTLFMNNFHQNSLLIMKFREEYFSVSLTRFIGFPDWQFNHYISFILFLIVYTFQHQGWRPGRIYMYVTLTCLSWTYCSLYFPDISSPSGDHNILRWTW